MEYKNFFALLGGLALFLYGMHQMSEGLNAAAGEKMKQILERLTKNRFLGVGVGAAVTAVIQSSSATTVMVVGFVNSGMMTLRQAVWIIMGANIGTTITGQLIALDAGAVAPLLAFLGVVLILFAGKDRIRYTGEIVAGLGILFIGMDMMGEAMQPLCDSQVFLQAMTKFEHPLLGILGARRSRQPFSHPRLRSVSCRPWHREEPYLSRGRCMFCSVRISAHALRRFLLP